METNNNELYNKEIKLQTLFIALWKHKIMIISITLIVAIITGLFSAFVITPVYQAKMNIIINMPEKYNTQYGEYTLPFASNQEYIELITDSQVLSNTIKDMGYNENEYSTEQLEKNISINFKRNNAKVKSFTIKVAADNPKEAKKLADVLYSNYTEFMDVMIAKGILNYFYNFYQINISSLKNDLATANEKLNKNEKLLSELPQTINQAEALQKLDKLPDVGRYIIMDNIVNPNYTKLEGDIIENRQEINDIENSMLEYNAYIEELKVVKSNINEYKKTGDFDSFKGKNVSISEMNVYLASPVTVPRQKSSPSNAKNALLGAILGGALAVCISLIKEFWMTKSK